jgi:polysaccharide biosynthesis protein PslH
LRSAAASALGVQVTGTVDDIRPYVREGSVYVVPLRIGSGTRLKIFEAMAMGKAIVSTTLGAEGLPIRDGVDISIADSPEEFSRKVCGLLRDPEERRSLGSSARQMVEQHYSWSAVAAEFNEVLRRVAPLSSAHEMKLPATEKVSALRA